MKEKEFNVEETLKKLQNFFDRYGFKYTTQRMTKEEFIEKYGEKAYLNFKKQK